MRTPRSAALSGATALTGLILSCAGSDGVAPPPVHECCTVDGAPSLVTRGSCGEGDVLPRNSCKVEAIPHEGPPCEPWSFLPEPEDFQAACLPPDGSVDTTALRDLEASMVDLMNQDRLEHAEEANQAAPLVLDCAISDVARLHSYRMCVLDEFEHVLDGLTPRGRVEQAFQWVFGPDFAVYGENIAYHEDLVEAEDAFVEEEPPCDQVDGGHRLNILDREYSHVGIGLCFCTLDAYDNFYLTQDFIAFDGDLLTGGNPYCLEQTGDSQRFGPLP